MGVYYESIPSSLIDWILEQHVFWVATAPLSSEGHVNVSPKGGKCFGVPDSKSFWYMDMSGSGNETIAHLHEPRNGRMTICFCAFVGAPKIVRLWGHGRVLERGTAEYDKFVAAHSIKTHPGTRSIIVEDIHQVGSSCGFNVPYFDFKDYRPILTDHFEKMDKRYREGSEKDSMDRYWAYKNAWSMDRAPAMQRALQYGKLEKIAPIKKMVGPLASAKYRNRNSGFTIEQVLLVILISFVCGALAASWAPRVFKEVRIDVSQLQKAAIRPSFALN